MIGSPQRGLKTVAGDAAAVMRASLSALGDQGVGAALSTTSAQPSMQGGSGGGAFWIATE